MTGRRILSSIILALVWQVVVPVHGHCSEAGRIAVLMSDAEAAYQAPVKAFKAHMEMDVEVFNLGGDVDRAPKIMDAILSMKPRLIFALGAKASFVAKVWTRDHQAIPVVFAMVINWEKYKLLEEQDNIAGVSAEVAPGTMFANMVMFSPGVRSVGVVYSEEHSGQVIKRAREAAARLGLRLVTKSIRRPRDFEQAYVGMSGEVDAFWIVADPVVYTLDNVSWVERRCIKDRLVCIGPSENIAKSGVLLSVDLDVSNIGAQAASIARNILLGNQVPASIGVMPPLGTRLFFNARTAREIKLPVSPRVLDLANEIIDN